MCITVRDKILTNKLETYQTVHTAAKDQIPARRLKIVHCLFTLATGGAQVLAVELLNEMSSTHDVSLVVINNKVNPALIAQLNPGIPVHYLNRKEGNPNPWPLVKLNLLLMRLKPDLIHCHEPKMARAIRVKNPKLLFTIHDVGIETSYYHLYDSLIAISDVVYREVKATFPGVKTIYNGIPVHLFKRKTRYAWNAAAPFRMVQLSRLMHEKKGQDILLHALHEITKRGFTDFTLDFVGSGDSEQYLKKLVQDYRLEDKVNFLGEKNRQWLYENLCDYDALIQPSRYEGFGLTILEGFASGLPVVASDIDGPAEILVQTPAGFLFRDGDTIDCADAIMRLIAGYQNGEIDDLMEQTLRVINNKYSVETCSKEYLIEYNRLKAV